MSGSRRRIAALVAATFTLSAIAGAQSATTVAAHRAVNVPHTITIDLVQQPGAQPFVFQPSVFTAHRGDTLRFVQKTTTMHNVHFKTTPKGAKLGSATASEYLTAMGQTYTVVVDSRFTDGSYLIVCDPHEMLGMRATLTVVAPTGVIAAGSN